MPPAPYPDQAPQGGYDYEGATNVMPAITDAGPPGYDYGGYDGATNVMPAIVEPRPGTGAGYDVGVAYDPVAGYDPGYPGQPGYAPDAAYAPESAYAPAPAVYADPSHADGTGYGSDPAHGTDLDHPSGIDHSLEPAPDDAGFEPRRDPAPVPAPRAAARAAAGASRTPIWDPPGLLPALCTAGFAGVLAVTAIAGKPALVLGVAFLQVLTAAGWFRLNGMWPARQGIALVVLAAFATDVAVLAKGEEGFASVPAVLAVTLLVLLAAQARGGARAGDLLPALSVAGSAALLTAFEVAYVVAGDLEGGPMAAGAAVVPAVLAAGAATLVRAVPLPGPIAPVLAWALGTAVGAGAGIALGGDAPYAAALGAGAAALGLIGHRTAGYDHPSRFVHFTAGIALPLALAAPAAYLLGRVMIG
jgi:hypothetical protein